VFDGMPFGALLGRFGTNSWTFLGMSGSASLQPVDVGKAFEVALNMSDTDLAALDGTVTVTVVYVPDDVAEVAQVTLHAGAPQLVPTGLIAQEGDQFLTIPYGALRIPTVSNPFTGGWFRPEGTTDLQRAGQPLADAPLGALCGTFEGVPEAGFVIGEAGCFNAQIADFGDELELFANMSAADVAATEGRYLVNVVRIPAPGTVAVEDGARAGSFGVRTAPNPTPGATTLRFTLEQASPALLRVADARGRWVRTVVDQDLAAGEHAALWDGNDEEGRALPAGAYFYQLSTSRGSRTGKVVISR
jgi:hypothetical protein